MWWPSVWRKAKNLRRRWIGGTAWWGFVPDARIAYFSIRSYPPSHFQAIACVGNDLKTRNLGSLWFEAKGRWASFFRPWTTASEAKKEGFSSSQRDRWWKMDWLQQPKEKKVMGTARSCIYIVGSAEYSRCEGYAVWERYRKQLMRLSRALREKRPQYEQRNEKVILQHDNVWPHVAKPVETYLETLKWVVLPHPPYSPGIAPSDYYLFRSIAHGLADQQFRSYEDIEKWLDSWISSKTEHFYRNGIRALPERWVKVVANGGQYFEWFICNHFFTIKLHFHQKNSGNLVAHLILF